MSLMLGLWRTVEVPGFGFITSKVYCWLQEVPNYLHRFKISAFWNDLKGVMIPPVLYVINAGVVEDTICY